MHRSECRECFVIRGCCKFPLINVSDGMRCRNQDDSMEFAGFFEDTSPKSLWNVKWPREDAMLDYVLNREQLVEILEKRDAEVRWLIRRAEGILRVLDKEQEYGELWIKLWTEEREKNLALIEKYEGKGRSILQAAEQEGEVTNE